MEILIAVLITIAILGIFLFSKLLINYFKTKDELKRISKPLRNGIIPSVPMPLDIKTKPNQTLDNQTGNKTDNPPDNTRLHDSINGFGKTVNETKNCDNTKKY
jgi:hypothetical protein